MKKREENVIRYDGEGIQKVMRVRDYFADSLGMFSLNVITGLVGQLTYFYTDKVGLAAGTIATIFMINKVFDAFTDVYMGNIVDNTPKGKEKYRPWILRMVIPTAILIVAMFMVPNVSEPIQLIYVLVTNALLTAICYTAIGIPYVALQIVRTNSQEERSYIGTWRAAAGYVSGMFIAIMVIPVTNMLGGNQQAWIKLGMFFAVLVAIFLLICYYFAKEQAVDTRLGEAEITGEEEQEEQMTLKESINLLIQNKYWVILLIVNFAAQVSYGISGAAGTYYAKWIYGNDNLVAIMGGLGLIPTILGFVLITPLVKKFGPTKLLKNMALLTAIVTAVRIINPDHFVFNTAMGLIAGFAGIPIMALTGVLMGMVVDYNQYKFGIKMIGRTSSVQSFTNKIGVGVGASIVGWSLGFAGYSAEATSASEAVRQAIFTFSIYIPLILNLIVYFGLNKFDLEGRMGEIHAPIIQDESITLPAEV